jgi:hypothetical protein
MKLDLYYPVELEPFIKQVKAKCLEKGVSISNVALISFRAYMEEDIYVPTDEPRDVLALKVIALFKEICPNWKVPDISEQLLNKIVKALAKVRKGPDYWEKLFRKAVEIPWKDWQPDFFWLLEQDNHFKLLSGRYDYMIAARDHEKHGEERRKKREAERIEKERIKKQEADRKAEQKAKDLAEKQRIKEEAAEQKAKEKEAKELLKHPELAEAKKKEEEEKQFEKERQERIEKAKHEPQWNEEKYMDKDGTVHGGFDYPDDWTEDQILDWQEKHSSIFMRPERYLI